MSKTSSRKLGITLAGVLALIVSPAQATLIGYTGTIQTYTVATTGLYDLTVAGAQGGSATRGAVGGLGAVLEGQVFLTAGLTLQVVVAGQGVGGSSTAGGGGGGGSFVFVLGNAQPLIVAGGGGGAFFEDTGGLAAETGQSGSAGANGGGAGGSNGLGGSGGVGMNEANPRGKRHNGGDAVADSQQPARPAVAHDEKNAENGIEDKPRHVANELLRADEHQG